MRKKLKNGKGSSTPKHAQFQQIHAAADAPVVMRTKRKARDAELRQTNEPRRIKALRIEAALPIARRRAPGAMRRSFVFSSRPDCSHQARAGRIAPIPLGPKLSAFNQNSRAHREKPGRATRTTPPGAPRGHYPPPISQSSAHSHAASQRRTRRNAPVQRRFAAPASKAANEGDGARLAVFD